MTPSPKPPEGEPVRPELDFYPAYETWQIESTKAKAYMDWQAAEIARLRAGNAGAEERLMRAAIREYEKRMGWHEAPESTDYAIAAVRDMERDKP